MGSDGEEVLGALTGQVPVAPACPRHRETLHETDDGSEARWCTACGFGGGTRYAEPRKRGGGWGTPSGVVR